MQNETKCTKQLETFETLETLKYRSPQLWTILPENLRRINSLVQFKESVRKLVCIDCPCRLSKFYLPNIGFL